VKYYSVPNLLKLGWELLYELLGLAFFISRPLRTFLGISSYSIDSDCLLWSIVDVARFAQLFCSLWASLSGTSSSRRYFPF
jgi:hypothetical protein